MTEKVVTTENFTLLLSWLDADTDRAAEKYQTIRTRLVRLFVSRGCHEADDLADETINRVTLKIPEIIEKYVGEPTSYFYGVANKVFLEWLRKQKRARPVELKEHGVSTGPPADPDREFECLEKCLRELTAPLRELIIEYYQGEKREKIEHHRFLAEKWDLTINALQTKTCRIRASLRKCVQQCLAAA